MPTAPTVDPIFQAISAAHWYALSGLLVSFALAVLRAQTSLLQKLPAWQQYVAGLAVTGGGAFVTAQATGHPLSYALTAVVVAVLSALGGLLPGVGHKDAAKPSAPKAPVVSALLLCLVLAPLCLVVLPSCALFKSPATVLDAITKAIDEVDAIVHMLDSGLQPWLATQPQKVQQAYADAMRRFWLVDDAARKGQATVENVIAAEQDLLQAVEKMGAPVRQAGEKAMAVEGFFTVPKPGTAK